MPVGLFDFDPREAIGGFVVLDPDPYVFEIEGVKCFTKKEDDGSDRNYGIIVQMKVTEGNEKYVGKTIFPRFYFHKKESWDFYKRLLLAAFGYPTTSTGDDAFNREVAPNHKWEINFEEEVLGDGHMAMVGRPVSALVTKKPNKETGEDQNNFAWKAVS